MKTLGNFFAFDNYWDFLTLFDDRDLSKWSLERGRVPGVAHHWSPGVMMTPNLKKHWYKDLKECVDKNIIIAWSLFQFDGLWDTSEWLDVYRNKNKEGLFIVDDSSDKIYCFPNYLSWCLESGRGVYFKKNLSYNYYDDNECKYTIQQNHFLQKGGWHQISEDEYKKLYHTALYKCMFPATESPIDACVAAYIKANMTWVPWSERKYDVFWSGQSRGGWFHTDKKMAIEKLERAAKKLGLKALIIGGPKQGQNLGRNGYMETIANSRLCYNFSIGPLRNRREWEVLLAGGCLVQDPRTKAVEQNIMEVDRHFIYFSYDSFEDHLEDLAKNQDKYEEIAYNGWKLAKKCWLTSPAISFRLHVAQGLSRKRIDTLEDLEELERKIS